MTVRVLEGDCRETLQTLPDASVQCVVTSPPYFGLRDYGTAEWDGGDAGCDHKHETTHQKQGATSQRNGRANIEEQRNENFRVECPKCGARRIDRQIGLESSVEAYVAELVAVFRDVRRVLRDDGVLFLNLGDSYASAWPCNRRNEVGAGSLPNGKREARPPRMPSGLKEKDLIGVPWLVAKALQAPYYTGTIKNELDRVWLAAMIDAEGCMFIHKRKEGQHNGQGYYRKNAGYGSGLEVANTSEAVVRRCMEITGRGSICAQDKDRRQTLYRWNLRSNECREVVREIYPYLVAKKQQARLLIGCQPSGERADAAHQAMILLHNGSETTVDFPEPASMYEPGYYLRSDIVWSKANPMPESVRDRPTKAHEYIFLLTKSPRYFWDAEAVKEEAVEGTDMGVLRSRVVANSPTVAWHAQSIKTRQEAGVDSRTAGNGYRNIRSVWTIATAPFAEAHFATFPPALAERCIKAGTSEKGACPACGSPWVRVTENGSTTRQTFAGSNGQQEHPPGASHTLIPIERVTVGWEPSCQCPARDVVPCTVLDPFAGAGTTALVADRLGRDSIAVELNPEYAAMIRRRVTNDAPLFAQVV